MSVTMSENSDEMFFSADQYILSETDDKGLITYANNLFCEMAGYKLDELIGKPHNIVRHPDMPRIAFKGLWDDIQSKGFWTGIVKIFEKMVDTIGYMRLLLGRFIITEELHIYQSEEFPVE